MEEDWIERIEKLISEMQQSETGEHEMAIEYLLQSKQELE